MDEPRIIPPEELQREKLFDQELRALEHEFKLSSSIEYDLTLYQTPPLIITNGHQFEQKVKDRVFDLFNRIFEK